MSQGQASPLVALPGAQTRVVRAASNGATYRISVWIPSGPPPSDGFPALYVLDANVLFATFVEAVIRSSRRSDATAIGASAVIGISKEGGEANTNASRQRDYTFGPPVTEEAPAADTIGGGLDFLKFIVDELVPVLRKELPLDAAGQTLFGHSLAGFFVLQAMAARPKEFRTWAAISPSIWWDEAGLHRALADALPGLRAIRVFLAVGEWEGELPPWQRQHPGAPQLLARRAQRRMVGRAQTLATELGTWLPDDQFKFHIFPEEDHASVLMIAVQRTLRFSSQ